MHRTGDMLRNSEKGDVAIFFTGGTICMQPRVEDEGVVPSGDSDRLMQELNRHVQGVGARPVYWADLPSPHMTPELMFKLAQDLDGVLADPTVLGAVVVHGTDVLVESAFMADLTLSSAKPVVFTGSMRYYSELGYDGVRNLINGIKACVLPLPPGTGVVLLMTDRLFTARDVAKINSLNVDAFESPGTGPVAYVAGDAVLLTRRVPMDPLPRPTLRPERIEPNVALISCYTGMDASLLNFLQERGTAGLVLEGFGAGNVPPTIVPAVEAMVAGGIPVVLTTRCVEGGVWPIYAYPGGGVDLRHKGVIMGGRLSGPKARIQLMLALGRTRDVDAIRAIFEHGLD